MSGRSNPFEGLEELFDRLSGQFEDAARTWDTSGADGHAGERGSIMTSSVSASVSTGGTSLDLAEHDDEFVVTVDVPGYDRDEIDVRLSNDTLEVDGERERDVEEGDEDDAYLRRERRHHSFSRRLSLPAPVDADDVSARLHNGVLTVRLGKVASDSGGHTIDIE